MGCVGFRRDWPYCNMECRLRRERPWPFRLAGAEDLREAASFCDVGSRNCDEWFVTCGQNVCKRNGQDHSLPMVSELCGTIEFGKPDLLQTGSCSRSGLFWECDVVGWVYLRIPPTRGVSTAQSMRIPPGGSWRNIPGFPPACFRPGRPSGAYSCGDKRLWK